MEINYNNEYNKCIINNCKRHNMKNRRMCYIHKNRLSKNYINYNYDINSNNKIFFNGCIDKYCTFCNDYVN